VEAKPDAPAASPSDTQAVATPDATAAPASDAKAETKSAAQAAPVQEAEPEAKPDAKAASVSEAQVPAKPDAKGEAAPEVNSKPPANLTPKLIERVHALYEELGRQDVLAVQELEQSRKSSKEKAIP
jgi:hypothetical protein